MFSMEAKDPENRRGPPAARVFINTAKAAVQQHNPPLSYVFSEPMARRGRSKTVQFAAADGDFPIIALMRFAIAGCCRS